MNHEKLVRVAGFLAIPPWGLLVWVSIPLGFIGLAIQAVGLGLLYWCSAKLP